MLCDQDGKTLLWRDAQRVISEGQEFGIMYESETIDGFLISAKIDYPKKDLSILIIKANPDIEDQPYTDSYYLKGLPITKKLCDKYQFIVDVKHLDLMTFVNNFFNINCQENESISYKYTPGVLEFCKEAYSPKFNSKLKFTCPLTVSSMNSFNFSQRLKQFCHHFNRALTVTNDNCDTYYTVMDAIFGNIGSGRTLEINKYQLATFFKIVNDCDLDLLEESKIAIPKDDSEFRLKFFTNKQQDIYKQCSGHSISISSFKFTFTLSSKDSVRSKYNGTKPISFNIPHIQYPVTTILELNAIEKMLYCCNQYHEYASKIEELVLTII